MDGALSLEPTTRGINAGKLIFGLSFFLPYLVDWVNEEGFQQLAIYAPTWVALDSEWVSYIGPAGMALLMFTYWLPYVYVGYQSYRFAQGKYSSIGRYVAGVAFVSLIAILLTLPMTMVPRASDGGTDYFSAVIPLPLVTILSLVLIPLLRPVMVTSPWDSTKHDVFPYDDEIDPV